jgi:hypothetical protein
MECLHTMMFVQQTSLECGYQLTRANLKNAPPGRIRVVRYNSSFYPHVGFGYYSDFYLREMIRNWKRKQRVRREKRMALLCCARLPSDTTSHVCTFF